MVAALPVWLGYVPTRSLVVVCCYEPRGRVGLTLRFDLPPAELEQDLVTEAVLRVVHQQPSRVLVAVYTDEPDDRLRARQALVDELCDQLCGELDDLEVTEALLVRGTRFWSYLCNDTRCCPEEGTPVDVAAEDAPVALLEAEQVLRGQVVLPDRVALERTLAGPELFAAAAARQRCEQAVARHAEAGTAGRAAWRQRWHDRWQAAVDMAASPPLQLDDEEAALLATSLHDLLLRDGLAAEHEPEALRPLLLELMRRTPAPFDAPVCTLFAWQAYCDGGGAEVTIALERALRSDRTYRLALLLTSVLDGQVPPSTVREITRRAGGRSRRGARRTGRR